jgi:hypothetical protein
MHIEAELWRGERMVVSAEVSFRTARESEIHRCLLALHVWTIVDTMSKWKVGALNRKRIQACPQSASKGDVRGRNSDENETQEFSHGPSVVCHSEATAL